MRSGGTKRRIHRPSGVVQALILLLLAGAASSQELGVMEFAAGEVQHVVRFDSEPWVPCPPKLPTDCEMAVLEGDPQGEDLFTVRFRSAEGFVLPAHWHPKDERVTLLQGSVAVAFGAAAKRQDAAEFGPGDYYVNARHAIHSVWVEGPTILQITGIGPWKVVSATEATPPSQAP